MGEGIKNVTRMMAQLAEAYTISGIDRKVLSNAQKRYVDKIFTLLIQKCNQNDNPISGITDALKEVAHVMKEDPLL